MIISCTPYRISFAGGGTDLKDFYSHKQGAVIATAIDKYVYITVNKRFDDTIRVSYSKTEIVSDVDQIKHPLVREALKLTGIDKGIEITSIADVPAGSGMGSSSSFTVGLLNALYAYQEHHKTPEELASQACQIEIDILKEPIGKQDQYIAAYGGLSHIQFNTDEDVFVDPIICPKELKDRLNSSLILFFTGTLRSASSILKNQKKNTEKKLEVLEKMAKLSYDMREVLIKEKDLDEFGDLLHQEWLHKKQLAAGISNGELDECYEAAHRAGALGGKILGAGGGGFLLLYCKKDKQQAVKKALGKLREFPFEFDLHGSRIIYVG